MNRLDRVKVVSRDNKKTVYQLNPRLQLKVIQYDGYCKVYYRVLNVREWAPSSVYGKYTFIAVTSSGELSTIFDEVDQLEIMSLQEFSIAKQTNRWTKGEMQFTNLVLDMGYISMQLKVMGMFDGQTDVEECVFSGHPYLRISSYKNGNTYIEMTLYRALSLYELVE